MMLDILLETDPSKGVDVATLKRQALQSAKLVKSEADYTLMKDELKTQVTIAQGGQS